MLSQMVFIHITLLLLDPHDIHHEGKKKSTRRQHTTTAKELNSEPFFS